VVALIGIVSGFSFGYNTGIISTARPIIAAEFGVLNNAFMQGLLTSTILVGAMFGSLGGGLLSSKLGRKLSNSVGSAFQSFGILAASFSPDIYTFLVARGIVGAGIGITAVVCPLYVSENADPNRRGFFGVLFQLAITFGIFVSNLVGWGLSASSLDSTVKWRIMLSIGTLFPTILLVLTILRMKEPPSHKVDDDPVHDILINNSFPHDDFKEKKPLRTLIMGFVTETVLACILQLTGINAVMFYGPTIISQAGEFFAANQNLFNIGIGFFNFVFTIGAVILVERLGRKPLMIFGTGVMSIALICLGVVFSSAVSDVLKGISRGVVVLICLFIFLFGFEIGPGCLFWVLVNENFPKEHADYKVPAATYANVLQWILNLVVSLGFLLVIDSAMETFLFFGGVGILCTAYLVIFMDETRQEE